MMNYSVPTGDKKLVITNCFNSVRVLNSFGTLDHFLCRRVKRIQGTFTPEGYQKPIAIDKQSVRTLQIPHESRKFTVFNNVNGSPARIADIDFTIVNCDIVKEGRPLYGICPGDVAIGCIYFMYPVDVSHIQLTIMKAHALRRINTAYPLEIENFTLK